MKKFSVLIPAYNPSHDLLDLVDKLLAFDCSGIIIINDGSNKSCDPIFSTIKNLDKRVVVLAHSINLGKGAALKTGLNYAYMNFSDDIGVVTSDADGQHLANDIWHVGESLIANKDNLIIGVREFNAHGQTVPFRSRFGNFLTKKLFKLLIGQKISDTQSGLRGIPLEFIPELLKINNNGYEFELNMLIACKYTKRKIQEITIKTVYIDNNKSSHFNPIIDSLKIYFVLFRFTLLSMFTCVADFAVFFFMFYAGFNILTCQVVSRAIGVVINYPIVKKIVFHCHKSNKYLFSKYISLVLINGAISYGIIDLLVVKYLFVPMLAKGLVESIIFIANFSIQRDFIFTRKNAYEN